MKFPVLRKRSKEKIRATVPLGEGTFVFFSQLHGKDVVDSDGVRVGKLDDVVASLEETYPKVTALVLIRGRMERFPLTVRWSDVDRIRGPQVTLSVPIEKLSPARAKREGEIFVRQFLLDRQVVDTFGAKVVRVNDVHFLLVRENDLRIVHVDVSLRGLIRRLGWEGWVDSAVRLARPGGKYLKGNHLIGWKYVQLLSASHLQEPLKLSIPQQQFSEMHPADLAEIIEDLGASERATLFRSLDVETAAGTLSEVEDPRVQTRLLETVPPEKAADILEEMPPDDAADILSEMPKGTSDLLLEKMEKEDADDVAHLLHYDSDTAGGMMTTEFVSLSRDLTVARTLAKLKELAPEAESIYYLYVVDEEGKLSGVLTLRALIVSDGERPISEIMIVDPVAVHPSAGPNEVAKVVEKYGLLAIPVVEASGKLVGIITVDDVMSHVASLAWRRKLHL